MCLQQLLQNGFILAGFRKKIFENCGHEQLIQGSSKNVFYIYVKTTVV